jgi:outer membrane biosynthesis protein TonB
MYGRRNWSLALRIGLLLLALILLLCYHRVSAAAGEDKPLSYDTLAERLRQAIAEKAPDYPKEAAEGAVQAMVEPLKAAKAELVQDDAEKYANSMARQMSLFSRDGVLARPDSAWYRFWLVNVRFWSELAAARKRPTPEEEALMAQQRGEIMGLIDQWLAENVPAGAKLSREEYHRSFQRVMDRYYLDPLEPAFKRPFTPEQMARIRGELLTRAKTAAASDTSHCASHLGPGPDVAAFGRMMVAGAAAMQTPQDRSPEWQEAARAWSEENDRYREAERYK